MTLNISILSESASAITINDSKTVDLDIYGTDISWNDFVELFYDRNFFYPNDTHSTYSDALVLINHNLNGISFNLLTEVKKCYENEIEVEEACWDPTKHMCLIKDLVCLESLNDFKNCSFKKSLKLSELKKILEYEILVNGITEFVAIIPIKIISCTQELKDIVFNLRFNVVGLSSPL